MTKENNMMTGNSQMMTGNSQMMTGNIPKTDVPTFKKFEDFDEYNKSLMSQEEKEAAERISSYQILRKMVQGKKAAEKVVAATVDNRTYPNVINLQNATGDALNQNPEGTCYLCTGINWVKFVVWMHTGKKLGMSHNEMVDLAFDSKVPSWSSESRRKNMQKDDIEKHKIYGGNQNAIRSIFTYNSNLENHLYGTTASQLVTEFLAIARKCGVNAENIHGQARLSTNRNNVIKMLNNYGPCFWSHDPKLYCSTEGSHAILICGYDNENMYFKNSWSDTDSNTTYRHLGSIAWSTIESPASTAVTFPYVGSIEAYSPLIWKNL